jgi:hypothetical protein
MEQSKQQRSLATKAAITLAAVVIVAVLGTLLQQLLFKKTIVAIASAVISAPIFTVWWLLWKSSK